MYNHEYRRLIKRFKLHIENKIVKIFRFLNLVFLCITMNIEGWLKM
jgi:hypothetical protein